jgi:ferredoxin, 2Fe-2S
MAAASVHVTLVEADGRRHELRARPGRSLMRAAVDAGVDGIAADCGGSMTCGTCHVYVDETWCRRLTAPSGEESEMLGMTAAPRGPTSRLSCQITLSSELDGLLVRLPPNQY